jgi:hypothetical protein
MTLDVTHMFTDGIGNIGYSKKLERSQLSLQTRFPLYVIISAYAIICGQESAAIIKTLRVAEQKEQPRPRSE